MPAYPWLFAVKPEVEKGEVVVAVPEDFIDGPAGKVVATPEALQLVAYLQSLKQVDLPDGRPVPDFLYKKAAPATSASGGAGALPDGAELYAANCQSCHQPNGEGLKGAFPPLKGSKVVLDDNPELMVNIIMNGYTGRMQEGFGAMPAVGTNNALSPEQVTAIMNHEKSSWGNAAKKTDLETIKKFIVEAKLQAAARAADKK